MEQEFCGISGGIVNTCVDRQNAIAGLKTRFWLFNIDDLDVEATLASADGDGNLQALVFKDYAGTYLFRGLKAGNIGTDDISVDDDGNGFFPQSFAFKIYDETQAQRDVLEDLAFSDVGVVYEDASNRFFIQGIPLGLSVESAPRSTGANPGDSTARLVTLSGPQNQLRKQVLNTDYATTEAILMAYEA